MGYAMLAIRDKAPLSHQSSGSAALFGRKKDNVCAHKMVGKKITMLLGVDYLFLLSTIAAPCPFDELKKQKQNEISLEIKHSKTGGTETQSKIREGGILD